MVARRKLFVRDAMKQYYLVPLTDALYLNAHSFLTNCALTYPTSYNNTSCTPSTPFFPERHHGEILVMFATKIAVSPSTDVSPAILTSTSNVFLAGELVLRTATNTHFFPCGSKSSSITCKACAKESKGIAYQCSVCRVLIHRKCAQFSRTIKTSTHDHLLTRTYSLHQVEQHENILCQIFLKKVNTEYAAYDCRACDCIAHLNCANDFKDEDKDQSATPEVDATQLVHLVEGINLAEDERVGPREIKHFSHPQHNLIMCDEKFMDDMCCEACMQFIIFAQFYGCAQCNFFLHIKCTKLPTTIKRGIFHEHPLTLVSDATSTTKLFKCIACQCYWHGFTYRCDMCKVFAEYCWDIQCCLIPKTLKHESHQHSISLAMRRPFDTCIACGKTNRFNFVCIKCDKFTLCFRCATLPLVARYEHDTHLLQLSYTSEDDSGEYYCLICEEERDHPDYWFYYCLKCKFTAHLRCVIGKNSCIKFGITYTYEDHEHPLTIVQKTELSPPCYSCGKSFVDVALECTLCKFNVHPNNPFSWESNCLQKNK